MFNDVPFQNCASRNEQRHAEIGGREFDVSDICSPSVSVPTRDVVESHCRILSNDCASWRPKSCQQIFSKSRVTLVPMKSRYKWERGAGCFCWHIDGLSGSPAELAEEFVVHLSTLRNTPRVVVERSNNPVPDSLEVHINVSLFLSINSYFLQLLDQQLRRCIHTAILKSSHSIDPKNIRQWSNARVGFVRGINLSYSASSIRHSEFRRMAKQNSSEWERMRADMVEEFRVHVLSN